MINSCVLFGMMLGILERDPRHFLPFLIAGSAGLLLCFPRLATFIDEADLTRKLSH